MQNRYRISSYSFRGNYSFLSFEIQRSHYISPKVTVHKGAETIQGRKLYEEIRYVPLLSVWSVTGPGPELKPSLLQNGPNQNNMHCTVVLEIAN